MSFSIKDFKSEIDRIFIAYSNVYLEDALKASKKYPKAEAIIMQPHLKGQFFSSAFKAVQLYKKFNSGETPQLFITNKTRYNPTEQKFVYKSYLLNVLDVRKPDEKALIDEKRAKGEWILQDTDIYTDRTALIVANKFKKLIPPEGVPLNVAENFLSVTRGTDLKSVSIASPKIIKKKWKDLLKD